MSLRLIKYFRSPSATLSDWVALNPTLAKGEVSYLLDSLTNNAIAAKVGPGEWNTLSYLGKYLPDKLHTLNVLGAAGSGSGVGFEIEENSVITGYFKTTTARTGFDVRPPAATANARLLFSALTADREYTFPNASGTISLVSGALTQNSIPFIDVNGFLTQDTGFSYNPTTDIISVGGQTVSVGTGTQNYVSKWTSTGNILGDSTIINTASLTTIFHSFASTNTVESVLKIQRESSGTPGVGIGASLDFAAETTANVNITLGKIQTVAKAITLGTEVGSMRITSKLASGVFTGIEVTGEDGTGATIKPYISSGTSNLTLNSGTTDVNLITSSTGQILLENEDLITIHSGGSNNTYVYVSNNFEVISSQISLLSLQTSTGNSALSALKVSTVAAVPTTGTGTGIDFESYVGSASYVIGSSIKSVSTDLTLGSEDFDLVFETRLDGVLANKFAIQSDGYLKIDTQPANDEALTQFLVRDNSTGIVKYRDGSSFITSLSVATANGFAGTVTSGTTPQITISTEVTGILKGNGAAVSAASAGTDYQAPVTLTTTGNSGAATFTSNTLNIPNYTLAGLGGVSGSGTSGQVAYFNGPSSIAGAATMYWDGTRFGVGGEPLARIYSASNELGVAVGMLVANTYQIGASDGISINFGLGRSGDTFITSVKAIVFGKEQLWDTTNASADGYLAFKTLQNGAEFERGRIQSTGQWKFNAYNSSTAFLGTPQGYLAFDDQGNIITVASSGSGGKHLIYSGSDVSPLVERANLRFTNGLSASDSSPDTLAKLGGALTENTSITGAFNLSFSTSNISLFSASPNFNGGTNILFVSKSTTRPTAPPTDGFYIWAEEINSNELIIPRITKLMVMDSYGNIRAL